ncbi:amidase [Methylocapsa sp. S129]|uniref:amidase n=1 Tax=Methylocapsa sp. S129 TaxID=1641869 RepID=UPI001AEEFE56|nr:amidase [Methylocapsa sp. S129]
MKPHQLSATALLAAYRARELSPLEAMKDVLDRVSAFEPHIRATYLLNAERALEEARASEDRWMRAAPVGALDGVPTTVKDNIATKGEAVPLGTAASDLVLAAEDAPPAARLREAGAIIFAKTTMPDYGMLSSGLSSFHALARNPWDLSRNPGGSSAGAAAAAAAGYGPLHVGTDIGGSVRLPAGWCGIFALKPSGGRIPIDPPYIGRVAGPMTRTVDDAALLMAALARPDARDFMSLPPQELDWRVRPAPLRGLRIGLLLEAGCGVPPTPEVRRAIEAAARDFALAGAIVEPLTPFLSQEMLDGLDRFWRMRLLIDIRALPQAKREKILPFIRAWAESASAFSSEQVFHGFSQVMAMRKAAVSATAPFDFVLSPTAPMTAYAAELPSPSNDPLNPFPHIGFTVAFNMSEQPAASINCGYSAEGLPIGLQIIGRRFDDIGVLSVSRAFEEMRRAQAHAWPEPPAL